MALKKAIVVQKLQPEHSVYRIYQTIGNSEIPTSLSDGEYLTSSNGTARRNPGSFWNNVATTPPSAMATSISHSSGRVLTEHNLQLRSCQPLRNTAMRPVSEAKRRLRAALAVHVESIGIGEDLFVAVTGLGCGNYTFAGMDDLRASSG